MSKPVGEAPAAGPASGELGRTGGHAGLVAAGILLSRVFGLVRELLVARYLGVGAHADVYASTTRLPNLLQNLLGEQTLSAAFIPFYSRMVGEGRAREAARFAGAVLGLLAVTATALALVGILLAKPLVAVFAAGYLDDDEAVRAGTLPIDRFDVSVDLVRIIFPMAAVLVLSAWALGILNSHRRFFLPYAAPVLWNLAVIVALLGAGRFLLGADARTVAGKTTLLHVIAWAMVAGAVLQLVVQLPTVSRLLTGFRLSLGRGVPGIRDAVGAFGPVVAGRGVVQLSAYLDTFLASLLAAGAVGAQRYASTLYILPVSLFAMSVAAAELPELSRLQRQGAEAHAERILHGTRQIAFLVLPTAVGFLAFGWLVVGLVFGRGEFGAPAQGLVTLVLAAYTVGLVPSTTSRLLQNLFYSLHETAVPARIATLRVTVSAAAGAALMWWLDRYGVADVLGFAGAGKLRLGAVGLGLGASLGAWLELVLLLRRARSRVPALALPIAALLRMASLAVVAAAVAGGVWWVARAMRGWLVAIVVLAVFALTYLAGAVALRFPEMRAWLGRLRR